MKTKVMLLLLFVFCYTSISAQGLRVSQSDPVVVTELHSFLSSSNRAPSPSTSIDVQNMRSLTTELQPSIYFYGGVEKTYGDKPRNLYTDLGSLSQLNSSISLKNNIEIVFIKLDGVGQLSSTLDLSLFSSFKNLKYIYVISSVATTNETIAGMIANYDEKYSIFYKIDKGDNNQ